jgi:hypothetical protein
MLGFRKLLDIFFAKGVALMGVKFIPDFTIQQPNLLLVFVFINQFLQILLAVWGVAEK